MMRPRYLPLGIVVWMGVTSAAAAQDGIGALTPLEQYRACPVIGPSLPDGPAGDAYWIDHPFWAAPPPVPDQALAEPDSWVPAPSAMARHHALRERLGEEMPTGAPQIRIFREYGHSTSHESSVIATRLAEGGWVVDEVKELHIGSSENRHSYVRWTLGRRDSEALEALLSDPCLWLEPSRSSFSWFWMSGQNEWTLEVSGQGAPLSFERSSWGFGRVSGISFILNRNRP